jgi:hypothetical protein
MHYLLGKDQALLDLPFILSIIASFTLLPFYFSYYSFKKTKEKIRESIIWGITASSYSGIIVGIILLLVGLIDAVYTPGAKSPGGIYGIELFSIVVLVLIIVILSVPFSIIGTITAYLITYLQNKNKSFPRFMLT